jgi:hypothetical protein
VLRGERGVIAPPPVAFFRVNEADRAWVDARGVPHPLASFTEASFTEALRIGGGARGRIATEG